jgi:hypothetical protein
MKTEKYTLVSKIIICGGRHFDNYDFLELVVDDVLTEYDLDYDNVEIVSGHCSGADTLGEQYAFDRGISCKTFPADWSTYGKSAGPIRNSQMIDYISDVELPIVIAFISPKARGTRDTVSKSIRRGYKVVQIPYDTEDTYITLTEGVSYNMSNDGFDFDWDEDDNDNDDLVKLTIRKINRTKFNHHIRYFGYKINRDPSMNISRKSILSYIRTPDGYNDDNIKILVDRCIEEFMTNFEVDYDAIIPVSSTSKHTSILADKLSKAFNTKVITTTKYSVDNLSLNLDKINKEVKYSDKTKFINNLQRRYLQPQYSSGNFSMRKIPSKYRKFINPMFYISNDEDINSLKHVLIVDEAITSGETIDQIINLLYSAGYSGDIDIFTLMSNR